MNERIKKVTTVITEKWSGFSKAVKIMIIAIPVAIIAIIILLAILLSHKNDAVLYSGLTNEEAGEIAAAISDMGITNVRLRGDQVIVPEDEVDSLRMQLAVQGYPKNSKNYDIWNDGVDLWSTDSDKREVAKQQREANIAAALRSLDAVQGAQVELAIPKTRDYAITQKEEAPSCSVILKLYDNQELTNSEVRAIYSMVSRAVEDLTKENISIIDTYGRLYEWVSKEEEEAMGIDASGVSIAQRRFALKRQLQNAIMADIDSFMTRIWGKNNYSVMVGMNLNFDDYEIVDTEYRPSPDSDNNSGVLWRNSWYIQYVGDNVDDGLVGFTPNADNSPDYPTLDGVLDGEAYYFNSRDVEYDVSNTITKTLSNGYKIDKLSVGVAVNTNEMTEAERANIASMVANAVGADIANVTVYNTVFPIVNGAGSGSDDRGGLSIHTQEVDSWRNILLFTVIALGVILIALLILSLFMSSSRRKKIRRRQELALAAAQAAAADNGGSWAEGEGLQEVDYNIASLTEEAGKESRETILKREIADFAQNSPEIVASILRNMLREELT